MKIQMILALTGLLTGSNSSAQVKLDSLVQSRSPDFIEGKVPTYYSRGHKEIAIRYQNLITDAITYYEQKYSKPFKVKLAVIDSANWLNEVYPYGFVFYADGWIGMNTGMSFESFKSVYGLQSYVQQMENELKANNITEEQVVSSFLNFYSLHELGHYFMHNLSGAKSPDNWTNEFVASYFSYEFLKNKRSDEIVPFELFCKVDRDNYTPQYVTIKDFNEKYAGTGLENYVWYHSNFYFLVSELYACSGQNFMTTYENEFPKNEVKTLQTDDIIRNLDKYCEGRVKQWVNGLESTKKKQRYPKPLFR